MNNNRRSRNQHVRRMTISTVIGSMAKSIIIRRLRTANMHFILISRQTMFNKRRRHTQLVTRIIHNRQHRVQVNRINRKQAMRISMINRILYNRSMINTINPRQFRQTNLKVMIITSCQMGRRLHTQRRLTTITNRRQSNNHGVTTHTITGRRSTIKVQY